MSIFVIKADGSRQLFDREKVVRTCIRMCASREIAEEIEMKIYEGIETSKILQMIFRLLSKYKREVKHIICLRRSLSLLNPKPDFERFIQILLSEHGYEVTPNKILRGKCVEHEVDAIVRKNGITYFIEVKHHYNYHSYTGLDESRIARAILEDVTEGYQLGLNDSRIDKAMIICNTKFSDHAKRYAECRGISQIGWNSPPYRSLQTLIEEKKLYPITCLKGIRTTTKEKLASAGIILLKQLTEISPEELMKTGISKKTLDSMIKKARTLIKV